MENGKLLTCEMRVQISPCQRYTWGGVIETHWAHNPKTFMQSTGASPVPAPKLGISQEV